MACDLLPGPEKKKSEEQFDLNSKTQEDLV